MDYDMDKAGKVGRILIFAVFGALVLFTLPMWFYIF